MKGQGRRRRLNAAMLPMSLQFVIAMIASAINDRMQRRHAYLEDEVAVLRELLASATGAKRLRFTARVDETPWVPICAYSAMMLLPFSRR